MHSRALFLLPLVLAAGCSPERRPPPQPAPRPQQQAPRPIPRPVPPPAPAPTPAPSGWEDLPLTPGTWTYEGAGASTSSASYGTPGASVFRIYCEGPTRQVFLQRYGAGAATTMQVRTSFGARSLPVSKGAGLSPGVSAGAGFATATLAARDPFLDNMIFSRGRISVQTPGTPMLVLPSWAEPARVVEDCRR